MHVADQDLIDQAIAFLTDNGLQDVQILASRLDKKGETLTIAGGAGNVNCRMQMCRRWVAHQDIYEEEIFMTTHFKEGNDD